MKKERFVEVIRVFATILVVLGHCTFFTISTAIPNMGCDYSTAIIDNSVTWKIANQIVRLIYVFHMPLFFALSGFVYGICIQQGKYTSYRRTIINKFRNLVLPYCIITILYNIPVYLWAGYFGNESGNLIFYFLGFGENHLWFLIALFYCFLFAHYIHIYHSRHEIQINIVAGFLIWLISRKMPYQLQLFYIDRLLRYYIWFICGYLLFIIRERSFVIGCFCLKFKNKDIHVRTIILKLVLLLSILILTIGWYKDVVPLGGTILALLIILLIFVVLSDMDVTRVERISNRIWFTAIDKYSKYIFYYGVPVNYMIFGIIARRTKPLVLSNLDSFLFICLRFLAQVFLPIVIYTCVKYISGYLKHRKDIQ